MLPAVRHDNYKTRLNRDVRSDASRELLDLTVERVGSLSVLLIVTFRPEFQPSWAGRGDPAGNPSSSPRRGLTELDRPLDWTEQHKLLAS